MCLTVMPNSPNGSISLRILNVNQGVEGGGHLTLVTVIQLRHTLGDVGAVEQDSSYFVLTVI